MQNQLADDSSASSILSKPDHILSFIKHALESANGAPPSSAPQRTSDSATGLRMQDLRIVEEGEEEIIDEADSDDEGSEGEGGLKDEEMTITAVNLLLSILEGTLFDFNDLCGF